MSARTAESLKSVGQEGAHILGPCAQIDHLQIAGRRQRVGRVGIGDDNPAASAIGPKVDPAVADPLIPVLKLDYLKLEVHRLAASVLELEKVSARFESGPEHDHDLFLRAIDEGTPRTGSLSKEWQRREKDGEGRCEGRSDSSGSHGSSEKGSGSTGQGADTYRRGSRLGRIRQAGHSHGVGTRYLGRSPSDGEACSC